MYTYIKMKHELDFASDMTFGNACVV